MAPLIRLALELLQDPAAPSSLKGVASATLFAAISTGIELPDSAPMAVWRWLLVSSSGASMLHLHELPSEAVAKDAVRILTADAEAGEEAREMATAVLRGENLSIVTDADILLLAEAAMDEGRTRRFTFVVEGVHELRGFVPDFIRTLRDRLATSPKPVARAAAVDVSALLPRLDTEFMERTLLDSSPVVRRAALEQLERVEMLDRAAAASIVRRHLSSEDQRSVIAAGLTTLGALVRRDSGRER